MKTSVLIIGDILVFLLFSYIGKVSHSMPVTVAGLFETAAPFLAGWLIVGALFGAFKPAAYETVRQAAKKAALIWLPAAIVGMVLRSLYLGRLMTDPAFITISIVTVWILLIPWRMIFARFANSRPHPNK